MPAGKSSMIPRRTDCENPQVQKKPLELPIRTFDATGEGLATQIVGENPQRYFGQGSLSPSCASSLFDTAAKSLTFQAHWG